MSTEKSTAKEILERWFVFNDSGVEHCVLQAMQEYATQEAEQQTKLLQQERDRAVELIARAHQVLNKGGYAIHPGSPFSHWIGEFLKQLNQQNEG